MICLKMIHVYNVSWHKGTYILKFLLYEEIGDFYLKKKIPIEIKCPTLIMKWGGELRFRVSKINKYWKEQ